MKAQDLMIGDWVRIIDSKRGFQMQDVSGTSWFRRWTEDGEIMIPYSYDEIEPIPLTPEILEKNGFYLGYTSNQEDAASQVHCTLPEPMWTWDEGAGSIQISFPNESDGGEMYLSDQNFDRDLHFVFCENIYVHELQHVLKLCGIDKTIEL